MKKFLALLLALVMSLSLVACGGGDDTAADGGADAEDGGNAETAAYQVAMITDYGDITDQSFNQTTYEACKAFCEANGVDFNYFKPTGDSDAERIAQAADILRRGGLLAIPTETVYGLGANGLDENAVLHIFEAKGRPQDNPLIVHICGMEMLNGIVSEVPERAKKLAAAFWPGPLTMVMPRGPEVSDVTCAGLDTVGVRMPSHPVVQQVIKASGVAFAAPSANLSGKPSPTNAPDTLADMDGRLPLILDGGESNVGVESTVVAVTGEHPMLLRPGYITKEQMEAVLGEEVLVSPAILEKLKDGEVARSPGMKYKHYAPKAQVTILRGDFAKYKEFIKQHTEPGVWALCFDGEGAQLGVPFIEYGKNHDGVTQAHHLFTALRDLDKHGAQVVYARCPEQDGVSMAVYNRLIRAAAFRVVEL